MRDLKHSYSPESLTDSIGKALQPLRQITTILEERATGSNPLEQQVKILPQQNVHLQQQNHEMNLKIDSIKMYITCVQKPPKTNMSRAPDSVSRSPAQHTPHNYNQKEVQVHATPGKHRPAAVSSNQKQITVLQPLTTHIPPQPVQSIQKHMLQVRTALEQASRVLMEQLVSLMDDDQGR